jgi:hypothetical protein
MYELCVSRGTEAALSPELALCVELFEPVLVLRRNGDGENRYAGTRLRKDISSCAENRCRVAAVSSKGKRDAV